MRHQFIPAITGDKIVNENERETSETRGLGLKIHTAPIEHDNSQNMEKKAFKTISWVLLLVMESKSERAQDHRADKIR